MLYSVLSHELMEGVRAFWHWNSPTSATGFQQAFDCALDKSSKMRFRIGNPRP